jgi:hypothetical protein
MNTKPSAVATRDHVTYEINQIGRNFECFGQQAAALATADHIRLFWAPFLKKALARESRTHPEAFSPIASKAIALLF